jgi:uncharacterized cupin superfamily protein
VDHLPPGSRSSHRHWHEIEDDFINLISSKLVLVDGTKTPLRAGDTAHSQVWLILILTAQSKLC